jgi:hypothetical protein
MMDNLQHYGKDEVAKLKYLYRTSQAIEDFHLQCPEQIE